MNSRRSMACSVREGLGKGYLTVFLTLILTVMLSFSMTLIVSAGENTRRFAAECVTDIGMNSILAEYHRELLFQYNVFFTDISYGTQVIAYENMTEHLKNYINHNLQGDDLFMQGVYGNLIHMELDNIAVNGALSACEEGYRCADRRWMRLNRMWASRILKKQVSGWLPCRARELWISICWRSRRKQRKKLWS